MQPTQRMVLPMLVWLMGYVHLASSELDQTPWRAKLQREELARRRWIKEHMGTYNPETDRYEFTDTTKEDEEKNNGAKIPNMKWGQDEYNVFLTFNIPGGG